MNVSSIMSPGTGSMAGDTGLDRALELMDARGLRHLAVLEGGVLIGIVSDLDLLEATGWLPSRVHACRGPAIFERLPRRVRDVMRAPAVTIGPEDRIDAALVEFLGRHIDCLPVVKDGVLVGMLTERDLLRAYTEGRLGDDPGRSQVVAEHMTSAPTTIQWYTSLGSAIALCRSMGVRHLPLLQASRLVGIVSERDLRRALGCGRHEDMPVGDIVTMEPLTVTPGTALSEAAKLMCEHGFSALPVVDQDECIGILTVTDVLEHCLDASRGQCDAATRIQAE